MSHESSDAIQPQSTGFGISTPDYRRDSDSYHCILEPSTSSLSEAVVSAVALVTDRDPLEMPMLFSVLDTDALDNLVPIGDDATEYSPWSVSFEYADCLVTIEDAAVISVQLMDADPGVGN